MARVRIEKKQCNFTIVDNAIFRDMRIKLKAKGLLLTMLSLPEDWDYTIAGLVVITGEGKCAIRSALNELEAAGYLIRERVRDEHGRLLGTNYVVYEEPIEDDAPREMDVIGTVDDVDAEPEPSGEPRNDSESIKAVQSTDDKKTSQKVSQGSRRKYPYELRRQTKGKSPGIELQEKARMALQTNDEESSKESEKKTPESKEPVFSSLSGTSSDSDPCLETVTNAQTQQNQGFEPKSENRTLVTDTFLTPKSDFPTLENRTLENRTQVSKYNINNIYIKDVCNNHNGTTILPEEEKTTPAEHCHLGKESLTHTEYTELVEKFSEPIVERVINRITSTPYMACLNMQTITQWCTELQARTRTVNGDTNDTDCSNNKKPDKGKKIRYNNYMQRDYSKSYMKTLEQRMIKQSLESSD